MAKLPNIAIWQKKNMFLKFKYSKKQQKFGTALELVPKELNHLAAILHVYAEGLNFMK